MSGNRRTRVLSDLHLGHDGCLIERVGQLEPLLEGVERVVFNGDTFEELAERFTARSAEKVAELRDLCRRCGCAVTFLTGNHDPGITDEHHLTLGGGRVFVTHGDTFFKLVSPWSRRIRESAPVLEEILHGAGDLDGLPLDERLQVTRRCARAMEQVEVRTGRRWSARLRTLASEAWPPRRPWIIARSWWQVPDLAAGFLARYRPEAEVVLFGHTHFPGAWTRRGKLAVNTGGFLGWMNARVVDVMEDGRVSTSRVALRHGEFRPGRPVSLPSRPS